MWRDEPPTPLPACHLVYFSVFFSKSKHPQPSLSTHDIMKQKQVLPSSPPRPAMAPPARRLRRSSARRSDPTRARSARRTVASETVWTTANGNGQQHFQGDIRDDRPLSLLLYFLFWLQDIITQVLPSFPSDPPGASPPPSVVDDRHRHQRQRPFGSYERGAGKTQPSDDRHNAKDISMVIQNDRLFVFSFFTRRSVFPGAHLSSQVQDD